MDNSIINILLSAIGIIAQILIFIASIYFLVKRKGTAAFLLSLGSGFIVIMSIFYQVIPMYFGNSSLDINMSSIYNIAGFFSSLFYVIFAIGFFMLLFKLANQPTEDFSQTPPNNY